METSDSAMMEVDNESAVSQNMPESLDSANHEMDRTTGKSKQQIEDARLTMNVAEKADLKTPAVKSPAHVAAASISSVNNHKPGHIAPPVVGAISPTATQRPLQPQQPTNPPSRPMDLHDAFSYLDRVKAEFSDRPHVYNQFLQVMRDFKANQIDANGVIARVMALFRGHNALILGFNSFLPPTHHIEPHMIDEYVASHTAPASAQVAGIGIGHHGHGQPIQPHAQTLGGLSASSHHLPPLAPATGQWHEPGNATLSPIGNSPSQTQFIARPIVPAQPVANNPPPTIAIAPMLSPSPPTPPTQILPPNRRTDEQFRKAIGFVRKVKQRFNDEPEVYRAFLHVLRLFHREPRNVREVNAQVTALFRSHQDLIDEFALFLPEAGEPNLSMPPPGGGMYVGPVDSSHGKQGAGSLSRNSSAQQLKRAADSLSKKQKRRSNIALTAHQRSEEESRFFDSVKSHLNNRTAYAEFLKCLNLFNQGIISTTELIEMVARFIGGAGALYRWFLEFIGVDPDQPNAIGSKSTSASAAQAVPELNLAACKRYGSYRLVPTSHVPSKCSGRTALAIEVLNDRLVSLPTFASEDSTFQSSKKNLFEEALFRCEDERYELDLLVESNLATIAVLEPQAQLLATMTPEQQAAHELGPDLSGSSPTIYRRALRKIYGAKTSEVLEGLQRNPAVAIPVILSRLRQKDDEWQRIRREWNKTWREVHLRNYYRALDHQAITFRAADKKSFALRPLISEIEGLLAEKRRVAEKSEPQVDSETSNSATGTVSHQQHQLEYCFPHEKVFSDVHQLVMIAMKAIGMPREERKAVSQFLGTFVPELFDVQVHSKIAIEGQDDPDRDSDTATMMTTPTKANNGSAASEPVLLFANNNLYGLLRIYQMAYDRLEKLCSASRTAGDAPFFAHKVNVVARFLDMQPEPKTAATSNLTNSDFYRILLGLLAQLVNGELDASAFEEKARFMFGTVAYLVFTYDKLLYALIKQTQSVLSDSSCESLIRLHESWRARRQVRLSEYSARMAAENLCGPREHIYRVERLSAPTRRLTIQLLERLLGEHNGNGGGSGSVEAKWSLYVDNFIRLETDENNLDPKAHLMMKRVLKHKHHKDQGKSESGLSVLYNLECKICINTYKMFFVENTEDLLVRRGRIKDTSSSKAMAALAKYDGCLHKILLRLQQQ